MIPSFVDRQPCRPTVGGVNGIAVNVIAVLTAITLTPPTVGRQFWGFGNRPMVGRRSADERPISRPMSYLNEPYIIDRLSADRRSPLINGRYVGRRSADCKVLRLIKVIGE